MSSELKATVRYLIALGAYEDVAKLLGGRYEEGFVWHHFHIPSPRETVRARCLAAGLHVDPRIEIYPQDESLDLWHVAVIGPGHSTLKTSHP